MNLARNLERSAFFFPERPAVSEGAPFLFQSSKRVSVGERFPQKPCGKNLEA
jgi:hypothetical protein